MTERSINFDLLGDKRVIAGWLLAPLAAVALWKTWTILVILPTYVVMLFVGMPALQFCAKRGWLQWWHALAVGWLAGAALGAMYAVSTDPYHAEISGPGTAVILQLYGVLVGMLFWLIAVFKNKKFEQRPTNWLLLAICVAAVVWSLWSALPRLEVAEVFGVVTRSLPSGDVVLRLNDGTEVEARAPSELLPRLLPGREVDAYSRLGMFSDRRFYWTGGLCRDKNMRVAPC